MVSEPERVRYFAQLACLARKKIHAIREATISVDDDYVNKILMRAASNAATHYTELLEMFDCQEFSASAASRRLNVRRNALGVVQMRLAGRTKGTLLDGYCVNLSTRGMCLETAHRFNVGDALEIRVLLYDAVEAASGSGKIVWINEVFPGFYMYGISFGV